MLTWKEETILHEVQFSLKDIRINRRNIMKAKSWLVLILVLTMFGCREQATEVDQSSIQEHADALAPGVRVIQERTLELIAQHKWLKCRLEKCIEKLEVERGLEPIPLKTPAEKFHEMFMPARKVDPNEAMKYVPKPEPFYVPYESPNLPAWPVDKQPDIRTLIALLNLQSLSITMYMYGSGDWIENFEKRLQRIDANQP